METKHKAMIQANELRIGNLIYINEVAREVSAIEPYGVTFQYIDVHVDTGYAGFENITPITITEEWLLKAGFEYLDYGYFKRHTESQTNLDWNLETGLYLVNDNGEELKEFDHIQYVHQLQNLYFALTGKELEFKL